MNIFKRIFRLALPFLLIIACSKAQEKYMSVTIDDMPYQHQGMFNGEKQYELVGQIIKYLQKFDIPAVGFVNEGKLFKDGVLDSNKLNILKMWLDAGLEFGNHTYSHTDINKVSFEEFKEDLLKGAQITRTLAEERGIKYEYFRHPYLRSGETEERMLELRNFLKDNNYKVAPVTIDNSEWIFAYAYNLAYKKNDTELMNKLGKDYVDYMIEKIKYWEDQSQKLFGRNIKQVLLIHANLLNAKYLGNLADAIKNYGYSFISLDEALADTAYQSENNYVGKYGPSWIHRWALERGVDKQFFEGEPRVPQYIKDYTDIQYE